MSYTEHDETMDSRSLDGITASGAAESSPVGVSQEAPGVERADPAGDRTESIAVRNIIDDFDLFNRKITKFSPFFLTRGTIFRGVRAERIVFLYAICTGKGNRITSNE